MNSKRSKPGRPSGFTLVELCIAAGVVAVLAAVALPSYRGHLLHAGRVDAVAALTRAIMTGCVPLPQADDRECSELTLDVVQGFSTPGPSARCWRR